MTCPIVKRLQFAIKALTEDGYHVIIVGDEDHPEIIGAKSYGKNNISIIKSVSEVDDLSKKFNRLGVGLAAQSTDGRIDASNDIVAFSTSDERLKENIKPLEKSLDKVCLLQGVEFNFKNNKDKTMIGFIAQDVEKIVPEVVHTNTGEDDYKSVSYCNVTALLVESIKELREEVKQLKEEIKELKNK